jgi:hypothetical protein
MHKFVPRSHDGIFRNERNRSTPLDPQTHVLGCFGPFRYCMNFGAKWAELVILMPKFLQRTHPIHPVGPETHVLGRFRMFHYCTNFGAKQAERVPLMPKFEQRSCVGIFLNECNRSTPLDPQTLILGRF